MRAKKKQKETTLEEENKTKQNMVESGFMKRETEKGRKT